jgi:hypothetical protein
VGVFSGYLVESIVVNGRIKRTITRFKVLISFDLQKALGCRTTASVALIRHLPRRAEPIGWLATLLLDGCISIMRPGGVIICKLIWKKDRMK